MLVVHGWPGSISEFYKIIGPLSDPEAYGGNMEDSFHVIAPSLPGFGFSDKPTTPGYNPEKMSGILQYCKQIICLSGDNRWVDQQFLDQVGEVGATFVLQLGFLDVRLLVKMVVKGED